MVKQPDTDMLVRSMNMIEAFGLSGHSSADSSMPGLMNASRAGESLPEVFYSEAMFVNETYDSRKTGITGLTPSPSVYKFCIGPEFLSFVCDRINTQPHGHFAIQLAFNFEAPLLLSIDGSEMCKLFFFVIPTDIPHQLISPEGKHLSFLIDPLSLLGRRLRTLFEDQDLFIAFNRSVISSVYNGIRERLDEFGTNHFLNSTISHLFSMISKLPECRMDERISKAVTRCRAKEGKEIGINDLARWTSLSKDRARHLFKENTGVSFIQFLKWLKTMEAIKFICTTNNTLTEAAYMAGFSDSAHLSRTFKEIFGLMPSSVLK